MSALQRGFRAVAERGFKVVRRSIGLLVVALSLLAIFSVGLAYDGYVGRDSPGIPGTVSHVGRARSWSLQDYPATDEAGRAPLVDQANGPGGPAPAALNGAADSEAVRVQVAETVAHTGPAVAIAPHFFQDVLLVVNFNWQNYLTQYHNLIVLFDQLYTPYFYDVKYMGDLGLCPHCRKNPELTLDRTNLLELNTSAGFNILQGLTHYIDEYRDRVRGVLYINDDILLDPQKIVTLDKSKGWIAEINMECSYENRPPERRCPWGRWGRTRDAYVAAMATFPAGLKQRIDDALGGPERYAMSYADLAYVPQAYFADFVEIGGYFWRGGVMSELVTATTLRTCGPVVYLPFTNIADTGRRGVRSFFDVVYKPDSKAVFAHGHKLSMVTPLNEIHMFRKLYGQLLDVTIGPRNVTRNAQSLYTRIILGDGFEIPP